MSRFTEVAAPFEERVGASALQHLHDAIALGAHAHSLVRNATTNSSYNHRVADIFTESLAFGSLPSVFFACALLAVVARQYLVHREAKELLSVFEKVD